MNKQERQLAYERERKAMNDLAMREFDRERAIEALHKEHIETMQKQIDEFYMRYAGSEGLTRAEAMKRADQMDVTKFADKAKKAVKDKDFSPETNEWLKTYNLKMKVSRLELLKEELNWELIQMYDKDYQLISESLREEARLELERQAGILGDSVSGARQRIDGIVNSDFYGKNFSERIWSRTGLYQTTQKEVFKSLSQIYATMDGYRNERNRLMDKMQTTEYETMRLLRTENARIGSQMQVEAYKENGFTHFIYVAEPGACDICGPLDGKLFPIKDAQIGLNLKPLHPNCRCSSYGYIAMERLVDGKWIDEATGEEVGKTAAKEPLPFVPAKNIKQANEYAKDTLGIPNVSYKGVDVITANEWNKGLRDTFDKFPKLKEKFGFVGEAHERNKGLKDRIMKQVMDKTIEANPHAALADIKTSVNRYVNKTMRKMAVPKHTMAQSWSPTQDLYKEFAGIVVNRDIGKDAASFTASLKRQVESKFHPVGADSIKSVLDHEIGHQLDDLLGISNQEHIKKLFDSRTTEELTNDLSKYTWDNDNNKRYSEMIAEAWSEYQNNPEPREIAKVVGETIEQTYKKQFE